MYILSVSVTEIVLFKGRIVKGGRSSYWGPLKHKAVSPTVWHIYT